jgi:hypothetical protein
MPSVNLRQLRDTRQLKTWLKTGQVVELCERTTVIGTISPPSQKAAPTMRPVQLPDFAARRRAIFGDRVLTPVADLIADRENSRY